MTWEKQGKRPEEIEVKERFEKYYRIVLKDTYDTFMDASTRYLRRAIRVNTLKANTVDVAENLRAAGWTLTPVPWCPDAFWIKGERLDIGNLLEHQLGYIYIQDPASMLPPIVLDPQPGERILDMCASPGSKTSQAAAMMQNTGIIVANDVQGSRLAPLGVNLQRMGVVNAVLTKQDGRSFADKKFDRVMVDVPCSGTGTIRRSLKSIGMFNEKTISKLSVLQYQLLRAAFNAIPVGGIITYSTCSVDPTENEAVVSRLLQTFPDADVLPIELDIVREECFLTHPVSGEEFDPRVVMGLRLYPQTNDTEGFFVTKITKKKH